MATSYLDFLTRVIDDGIAAATLDYKDDPDKLKGAVAGFEACRSKDPTALAQALADARTKTQDAYRDQAENYWETRCFEAEIEWTCNCVSAMLMNQGLTTIVPPTARGVMKAAEILGVG
jgi:hypothetical protein